MQRKWGELIRALRQRDNQTPLGPAATGYIVSGTVTTGRGLDLATPSVTATTEILGRLIADLKDKGILG